MAFLLLKINNLNGANALLAKSNSFISENMNEIGSSLQFELAMEEAAIKTELETKEKTDKNQLIYHENVENLLLNKRIVLKYDIDDIGSYESLYSYFFIAGIFEYKNLIHSFFFLIFILIKQTFLKSSTHEFLRRKQVF
jgi:hypothetical protein